MTKEFDRKIEVLCHKYASIINDPVWEYDDLVQESWIIELENMKSNKKYKKMSQKDKESYLFRSITNEFIDIARRMENKRLVEDFYSAGENTIEENNI